MIICGLKLTHDAAVAVIKDNKLLFCDEVEKINNNSRYSEIHDVKNFLEILKNNNLSLNDIDLFAIDGWGGYDQDKLAIQPRLTIGKRNNFISIKNKEDDYDLSVAEYEERSLKDDLVFPKKFKNLKIGSKNFSYHSYLHVAGHVMGSYVSSPFSQKKESAYVLVWDGGMFPRLYFFDNKGNKIVNLGPLSFYVGNIYTIFSQHFGPFKVKGNFAKDDLSIAGKVMAYIGDGVVMEELFDIFDKIYYEKYTKPMGFANFFANEFKREVKKKPFNDKDILASFHRYLELHLITKLNKKINHYNYASDNLCMAGGCALNIKWNSAIRETGMFKEVYIPPFPNDSGSAIGVACCANYYVNKISTLKWSVYSGPKVIDSRECVGWTKKKCDIKNLANLIFITNEPIMIINGRAELGPRALGSRSIVANASSVRMKDVLNEIKKRETYRPISPICLEENAKTIFSPGTKDAFMLFDHMVKKEWRLKIPAVIHADNTARLQTVNKTDNNFLHKLLSCYYEISKIPVLCNTSANMLGKGFFPDIKSATKWGRVNYLWCDGCLYTKNKKNIFKI